MITIILLFLVFISYLMFRKRDVWKVPAPPHPPTHPLLGNISNLRKLDPIAHFAFDSLSKTFGPIIRLKLGLTWSLLVGGYEEMKVFQ